MRKIRYKHVSEEQVFYDMESIRLRTWNDDNYEKIITELNDLDSQIKSLQNIKIEYGKCINQFRDDVLKLRKQINEMRNCKNCKNYYFITHSNCCSMGKKYSLECMGNKLKDWQP